MSPPPSPSYSSSRDKSSSSSCNDNSKLAIAIKGTLFFLLLQYYINRRSIFFLDNGETSTMKQIALDNAYHYWGNDNDNNDKDNNNNGILHVKLPFHTKYASITQSQKQSFYKLEKVQHDCKCWLPHAWGSNTTTSILLFDEPTQKVCNKNLNNYYSKSIELSCNDNQDKLIEFNKTKYMKRIKKKNNIDAIITLVMSYDSNPAMLLAQLNHIASTYPIEIQKQITLLLLDDVSQNIGLQSILYIDEFLEQNQHRWGMTLRVIRTMDHDNKLPISGSRNLGVHMANTPNVLLIDKTNIIIPVETMQQILTWETIIENNDKDSTKYIAHRFMYKQQQQDEKKELILHPGVTLLHTQGYWSNGGYDEDFLGRADNVHDHFWYRWNLDKDHKIIQQHDNNNDESAMSIISTMNNAPQSPCDDQWVSSKLVMSCRANISMLPKSKDYVSSANENILERKISNGCWSNMFIRMRWKIEI